MDKMSDVFLKSFKEQQQIKNDQELEHLLSQENMTLGDLKKRLVESFAPDQVVRYEVNDRVSVGEKEIESYYAEHGEEFDVSPDVTIREIVLLASPENLEKKREEAARIRERAVQPGADFAALATEVSEAGTRTGGGLLGPLKKGDLSEQLETVAFTLPIGEVSPVLEASYGFHIVMVQARTEPRRKTLAEVHDELRRSLENKQFQVSLAAFLKKARAEATVEVTPAYRSRLGPEAVEPETATP
jgi:parvulin-like peptidyl-prolyl isomerase